MEIEILKQCRVEGNNVYLPEGQLERPLYAKVAKKLNDIGGKWKGGKIQAFVFPSDPTELLQQIVGGEKINLKKDYQFFATPDDLADVLVELAELDKLPVDIISAILEPSAGDGAIVKAINRALSYQTVSCYEAMPTNIDILKKNNSVLFLGEDFLQCPYKDKFDRIIANPPFANNQDIDHVYKMFDVCKPKGIIVTIVSDHWTFATEKKCVEFREWVDYGRVEVLDLDQGTFKDSGTMVSSKILIIRK